MYKLIAMPPSHYCEKARWGLDLAGVDYVQDGWPPVLHVWGTRAMSGSSSVPILQCPSGEYIPDSSLILKYLHKTYPSASGLYPADPQQRKEVEDLESLFCDELGVAARVITYNHLFKDDQLCVDMLTQAVPATRARIFRAMFPLAKMLMRTGMQVTERHGAQCLKQARQIFADVSSRLSDGRQFLVGDRLSAADISFAAMAALLILPEGYGARLPSADQYTADHPCRELRSMPAGQFALRLFKEHRQCRPVGAVSS